MSQATSRIIGDLSKEDDQMIRILHAVEHHSAHVMIGRKQIGVSIIFLILYSRCRLIVVFIFTNIIIYIYVTIIFYHTGAMDAGD
jgi:hypothetical protein